MRQDACDEKGLGRKNRRDTLLVIGAAIVMAGIAVALAIWLNPGYSSEPYKRQEYVLDDVVTITAYGRNQSQVEGAVEEAFREVFRVEEIADRYDPESEIARVNATAAAAPVYVSDELWQMIVTGMEIYEASGGVFDITVAPLVDVWDVVGRDERGDPPPSGEEIGGILPLVGADRLVLDETAHSVFFSRSGMGIDLGGIAKGYALDKAAEALTSRGVDAAIIDMISTSMTLGEKPKPAGGPDWLIAISNPRGEGYLATFSLPGRTFISTSGDNQRYFEYGGVRYHHILDPRTGYPAQGMIAVTVIGGGSGAWSDAMSTAAFTLGYPEGINWLEGLGDAETLAVDPEGSVHVSPGLEGTSGSVVETVVP
ncbi:MAG: FAD:protein FMN transferase [Actinomycetota bacterium]|nr:FAD:protein FMN transferase [Actinomycetota bacterium]MDD5666937.1 FAD:protein FMN transferase [Actinomycetota bacterium]